MNEARRNTIVGLFVLVGLAALATLITLFSTKYTWAGPADAYELIIRFDSASGIREGTPVTIGGVDVGRIVDVRFVNLQNFTQGVQVRARFNKEIRIRQGARAGTTEPGLGMGRPPIEISPGAPDAGYLESGASIPGQMAKMMESLLPPAIVSTFERTATQIGEAAAALTPVLNDLHEVLERRDVSEVDRPGGKQGNLVTAIARLDATLKNVNEVVGDASVKSGFRDAIENLRVATEGGKQISTDLQAAAASARQFAEDARTLTSDARGVVQKLDTRIDELARSITEDLNLAAQLLTRWNEITERVNRGEGTVGRLARDERLYEAMTLSFRRLAEAMLDLQTLIKDFQSGKVPIKVGL